MLKVGDILSAKVIGGSYVRGEITKFNMNTLILQSGVECYLVRLKDLSELGYTFNPTEKVLVRY